MITLITGVPGSGKSAALVDLLTQHGVNRPLHVYNVPDLKLSHTELDPLTWHTSVPDGAVIVADEVQRVWPPRGPGAKVPPSVEALQTHRHRGIDVYLVSQSPALVDKAVRALVGRHVHLRDVGILGRVWYEWPECSEQVAWRTAPIKRRYKLPKKVFGLYTSASLHVKPVRGFPRMLLVAALGVVALGVLAFKSYQAVVSRTQAPAHAPVSAPGPGGAPSTVAAPVTPAPGAPSGQPPVYRTAAEIVQAFTPRIASRPETAPAYDHLRLVVRMPRIQGGFCRGDDCRCYLQGGLPAQIPAADCRAWVQAPPFDAYSAPQAPAPAGVAPGSDTAPPAGAAPL